MFIHRCVRYITKCKQVGLLQAIRSVQTRITQANFNKQWRAKAFQKKANHTWSNIVIKHTIQPLFAIYFEQLKEQFCAFPADQFLISYSHKYILEKAHQVKNNVFDILGSGPVQLKKLSWHADIRMQTSDNAFCKDLYFKDIQIVSHNGEYLGKDIKIPWELSRFQHLIFIGKAFQLTKDESYVVAFTSHIMDWIDANQFLLGVNWVCPMEVALRAINWIWAFYYFKEAPIASEIWEKFTCSLYDHFVYLESNWELYDGRTSNHYLSDLVGYLYLCFFFSQLPGIEKKAHRCSKNIMHEMQRQVFVEGTSYEGSTQYHRLVTELFYHAKILMQQQDIVIPTWYQDRLEKMVQFIDWCSPSEDKFISIGDHDSGSVLYGGLSQNVIQRYKKSDTDTIKHYSQFGLSIMKKNDWHITLRHHAYNKKQPSGHFHNDVASITLAYQGIPIFVDPGSYVYTASVFWRNYFRSVRVHNTFFIEDEEPVSLDGHLFGLDLPEQNSNTIQSNILLCTEHNLYKRFGLQAQRKLEYDGTSKGIKITDTWLLQHELHTTKTSVWNFTLAPELEIHKKEHVWIVSKNKKALITIISDDLAFEVEHGWVSPAYGVKEQSRVLRARAPISHQKKYVIHINADN